jgi:hypothetical protein
MIETLEIRLAQNLNKKLETEIEQVLDDVVKSGSVISMKLYKKNNLHSDYLIIIMYSINEPETKGIELGRRIKSALNEYGLVNHNVWNEVKFKTISNEK